jgi:hypothetical protein
MGVQTAKTDDSAGEREETLRKAREKFDFNINAARDLAESMKGTTFLDQAGPDSPVANTRAKDQSNAFIAMFERMQGSMDTLVALEQEAQSDAEQAREREAAAVKRERWGLGIAIFSAVVAVVAVVVSILVA